MIMQILPKSLVLEFIHHKEIHV